MKKALPIVSSILIGAVAVGIGMGIFLKKANDDRARLADAAEQATRESQQAQDISQRAVIEANRKLTTANEEIMKAQEALKSIKEEQAMLARAEPLLPSKGTTLKGWKEAINLTLGLSIKYPETSDVETNDPQALTIASLSKTIGSSSSTPQTRWVSITPYNERLEADLMNMIATSTPVLFSVKNHLLNGIRGTTEGTDATEDVYVLRIQNAGQPTHLIWITSPVATKKTSSLALDVLSTLDFQQ